MQLITSTDDTIYIDTDDARKKGMVLGGYSRGDEIYVLPAEDHTKALMTINKNHLLGEWAMPSPFDGSTPSGVVLKDGGEAESLGQQGDIIYVTPNDKRRRESTINGNNVRSSSFWISIGSLATSVALLIFRLK